MHLTLRRSTLEFLSTPSGWRATLETCRSTFKISNFYPRPPGGGRPSPALPATAAQKFLSTPSGWRATKDHKVIETGERNFYPRPPGGGRRFFDVYCVYCRRNFYPRPPGGGRLCKNQDKNKIFLFLSTPSGWRATLTALEDSGVTDISIHALRVEGDGFYPY